MREIQRVQKKVIACFCPPAISHAIPLLRIAKQIKQQDQYHLDIYSSAFLKQKINQLFPDLDIITIQDQVTQNNLFQLIQNKGPLQTYGDYFQKKWKPLFDTLAKPDLVLCDFGALETVKYAIQNQIYLVINCPASLNILQQICNLPSFNLSLGIGGFTVVHPPILKSIKSQLQGWNKIYKLYQKKSLILVNSFFGLDSPMILPPNYVLTGPIIGKTQQQFNQYQFGQWIKKMKLMGKQKFIYVNFGTIIKLSKQFLQILIQGFKQSQLPIIWSLKTKYQLDFNQQFFISKWFPQQQILKLPQVSVFVGHAGWNGILQAIYYGKPMLLIPITLDQPANAALMVKNYVAIQLKVRILEKFQGNKLSLNSKDIVRAVHILARSHDYRNKAQKLSKIAQCQNGVEIATKAIKKVLKVGYQHLIDVNYINISHRTTFHTIGLICGIGMVVFLVKPQWFQKIKQVIFK